MSKHSRFKSGWGAFYASNPPLSLNFLPVLYPKEKAKILLKRDPEFNEHIGPSFTDISKQLQPRLHAVAHIWSMWINPAGHCSSLWATSLLPVNKGVPTTAAG